MGRVRRDRILGGAAPPPSPEGWLCGAPAPGCLLCSFTSRQYPLTGIRTRELREEMLFSKYTWIWTSKEHAVLSSYPAQSPFGRLHHWVLGFSLLSSTFHTVQSQSDARSPQSLLESVLMRRHRAGANYLVNSFLSFITLFPMFRNRDRLLGWNTKWLFFYTEITWEIFNTLHWVSVSEFVVPWLFVPWSS